MAVAHPQMGPEAPPATRPIPVAASGPAHQGQHVPMGRRRSCCAGPSPPMNGASIGSLGSPLGTALSLLAHVESGSRTSAMSRSSFEHLTDLASPTAAAGSSPRAQPGLHRAAPGKGPGTGTSASRSIPLPPSSARSLFAAPLHCGSPPLYGTSPPSSSGPRLGRAGSGSSVWDPLALLVSSPKASSPKGPLAGSAAQQHQHLQQGLLGQVMQATATALGQLRRSSTAAAPAGRAAHNKLGARSQRARGTCTTPTGTPTMSTSSSSGVLGAVRGGGGGMGGAAARGTEAAGMGGGAAAGGALAPPLPGAQPGGMRRCSSDAGAHAMLGLPGGSAGPAATAQPLPAGPPPPQRPAQHVGSPPSAALACAGAGGGAHSSAPATDEVRATRARAAQAVMLAHGGKSISEPQLTLLGGGGLGSGEASWGPVPEREGEEGGEWEKRGRVCAYEEGVVSHME